MLPLISCSSAPPKPVEVARVCSEAKGTDVVLTGYFSLPKQLEVTKYTKGGQGVGIDYRLYLMTKQDATGNAVPVLLSGTIEPRRNMIKMLPERYTWYDLVAYTDDDKASTAGQKVKITGTVDADGKDPCRVNVSKIESAEQAGSVAKN